MRTRITKIVRALCMTVLCAMLPMQMAFAAGDLSVTIPVEISLEGTLPEKAEEFVVEMAADDVTYPMPEGSKDGICTMTLTGAESKKFPEIRYDNLVFTLIPLLRSLEQIQNALMIRQSMN